MLFAVSLKPQSLQVLCLLRKTSWATWPLQIHGVESNSSQVCMPGHVPATVPVPSQEKKGPVSAQASGFAQSHCTACAAPAVILGQWCGH